MAVKVDVRVPVGRPLPDLAEFVRQCEDTGFHGLGIHDHHHTGRDVYLALTLAAALSRRLELHPATSNSVTRHPFVLASVAQSLSEIARRRILLTLAPGFLSVEKAGERRASREQLREVTASVRGLLVGRRTDLGSQQTRLRNLPAVPPKVMLLASGPRLLELAGEVADGALMLVSLDPGAVAQARKHLQVGAARAGRDPRELEEIFIVSTAVGDRGWATDWPRQYIRPWHPRLTHPSASHIRWLGVGGIDLPDNLRPEDVSPQLARRICDVLGLFGLPEQIRHSNLIERTFGDTRRCVKVTGRLPGEQSCLSLVSTVPDRASKGWRGLPMTPKTLMQLQALHHELISPRHAKTEPETVTAAA